MKNFNFRNLKENSMFVNIAVIFVFFLVLFVLVQTGVLSRYLTSILILVLVMIIMSTSLNIATGFLGQLHLGHAAFMGIGAYTASLLGILFRDAISSDILLFIVSTAGAMVLAGIAGLLIGWPALRLKGDYLGIMTLGFGEIVKTIITNMKGLTNGAQGLYGIPKIMNFQTAFWTTVLVVTVIFLFMNSRHGRAILSIREDEIASESVGINISRYKLLGFVIASMFAAVGGSIFAFNIGFIAPQQFNFLRSVEIFVIVVLGGMGSLTGSIIASFALVSLPELLREFSSYRYLLYSALLVVTMLFRPQGLMGTRELNLQKLLFKKKTDPVDNNDELVEEGSDS